MTVGGVCAAAAPECKMQNAKCKQRIVRSNAVCRATEPTGHGDTKGTECLIIYLRVLRASVVRDRDLKTYV